MTATNVLLLGLVLCVVHFGTRILAGLPKPSEHKDFSYESCDHFVLFRIDALTEKDFEVSFVDDWNVGRPFMLYGPLRVDEDNDDEMRGGLQAKGRVGVHIYPSAQWFEKSRIGQIRVYDGGGWECHISLPFQIARHLLEDVRRDRDQDVMIGFAKTTGKDGKVLYPIYSFELSEAWDK